MPVPAGPSSVVTVDQVKVRLKIPAATTTHDDKIQEFIDAAEAAYARMMGRPVSGSDTKRFDGGVDSILLPPGADSVTAAAYTDGTTVDTADLYVDNGIVYWGYGTAGRWTRGTRNVELTYTVETMPADHREVILGDVAGYFAATQRMGDPRQDENGYVTGFYGTPSNPWPGIAKLAASLNVGMG